MIVFTLKYPSEGDIPFGTVWAASETPVKAAENKLLKNPEVPDLKILGSPALLIPYSHTAASKVPAM